MPLSKEIMVKNLYFITRGLKVEIMLQKSTAALESIFSRQEIDRIISASKESRLKGNTVFSDALLRHAESKDVVKRLFSLLKTSDHWHLKCFFVENPDKKELEEVQTEIACKDATEMYAEELFPLVASQMQLNPNFLEELAKDSIIDMDDVLKKIVATTQVGRPDHGQIEHVFDAIHEKRRTKEFLIRLRGQVTSEGDRNFISSIEFSAKLLPAKFKVESEAEAASTLSTEENIIRHFSEFVSHLGFNELIKYCGEDIFSKAELEKIEAKSEKFSQNRTCLLVLLAKANSEKEKVEKFVRVLRSAGRRDLAFYFLQGDRCGELACRLQTGGWLEQRDEILVDRRRVISEKDVPLLQEFLREAKAAAEDREKATQKKNAALKKSRQRVHLAQAELEQAKQAATFLEKEFPEMEELADLEAEVKAKKARLEEALMVSEAEELEKKAGQAVAFLLREKVLTKAGLKVVVREKKEALDTVEQRGKKWEVVYLEREASADARISKSEKAFLGIDGELLFDCCSGIAGQCFPGDFEALLRRRCGPLGLVLAQIIDVENTEAIHGLYIAFRKLGYVEAVRGGRNLEQKARREAVRKKLRWKTSSLVPSIVVTESLLDRVYLEKLISRFDRVKIPKESYYAKARVLLHAIENNDDAFEQFGACLRQECQELPYKYLVCDDYRDERAERFNKNWETKEDLIRDMVRGGEQLNPVLCFKILDEFARGRIISPGWADQLKEECAKGGSDRALKHIFESFTFDQIHRGWEIISENIPELSEILETDDMRGYCQVNQSLAQLDRTSCFFSPSTMAEPAQVGELSEEESEEELEEEWVNLNGMSVN